MVFQAFAVWPHLNVFNNVAFPLQIRKMPKAEIEERTRRAITYTGLSGSEHTYPNELSGGQKQRALPIYRHQPGGDAFRRTPL